MTDKKHTVEFVKKWMDGHEPDTFVKNQHGNFIYSAGPSSINLTTFFEMLLEDYLSETFKGIDNPAEWVENAKSEWAKGYQAASKQDVNRQLAEQLQAENERLKKEIAVGELAWKLADNAVGERDDIIKRLRAALTEIRNYTPNSDEDMIEFYEWCDTSEQAAHFWRSNRIFPTMDNSHLAKIKEKRKELIQLWKEQRNQEDIIDKF